MPLSIWQWETYLHRRSALQAQAQAAAQQNNLGNDTLSGLGNHVWVDDGLEPGHIQPGGGGPGPYYVGGGAGGNFRPIIPLYQEDNAPPTSVLPDGSTIVHQPDGDYVWSNARSCWVNRVTGSPMSGSIGVTYAPAQTPPPDFSVPVGEDSLPQLDRIEARLKRLEAMLKTLVE